MQGRQSACAGIGVGRAVDVRIEVPIPAVAALRKYMVRVWALPRVSALERAVEKL